MNKEKESNVKILIYPYTQQCKFLVEMLEERQDISSIELVCLKGWGYENDIIKFRNREIIVSVAYEEKCNECDEVWFWDTPFEINEERSIYPRIQYAKESKKTIRYFRTLNETTKKILDINYGLKTNITEELKVINTPIILVADLYEKVGEMQVELLLNQMFYNKGYKVIQIGSVPQYGLLGMYPFPEFMQYTYYEGKEKILQFNQYIKKLEEDEKPDLFIIGINKGVGSFSREIVGDFGLLFSYISMAIPPDIFILSLPYEKYTKAEIEYIQKYIWERYKVITDYINIMPKKINGNATSQLHKLSFLTLENTNVIDVIKELDKEYIFCIDIKSERERLKKEVISKLLSYGEIQFL